MCASNGHRSHNARCCSFRSDPGSYTVRDHAQYLHGLTVSSGSTQLPVRRLEPSRWVVDLDDLEPLTLAYTVIARDLTVRTCHLDPDGASLCLAALVIEVDGRRWASHDLEILAPDHWETHVPLERRGSRWSAVDLDALIDSPVHAGPFPPNRLRSLVMPTNLF